MLHVAVNSNYASFTDTEPAIDRMAAIYGDGRASWHFPKTDLHHGLLGRHMGGGIAFPGVLCNQNLGFGLSTGLTGNYSQMSSAVVWDFSVVSMCSVFRTYIIVCACSLPPFSLVIFQFMHEIGHNFGSDHTHDSRGYSPLVDNCGNSCPSALPLARSTTLMSYCDLCS